MKQVFRKVAKTTRAKKKWMSKENREEGGCEDSFGVFDTRFDTRRGSIEWPACA